MASDEVKQKKSKDKSSKEKKHSDEGGIKKEKKDKKKDKAKQDKLARALDAHLQADAAASVSKDDGTTTTTTHEMKDVDPEDLIKPAEELVPFALPLADDKAHKKIYKLIKKGMCFYYLSTLLFCRNLQPMADMTPSKQAPS